MQISHITYLHFADYQRPLSPGNRGHAKHISFLCYIFVFIYKVRWRLIIIFI